MKKQITTLTIIALITISPAYAFDLGGLLAKTPAVAPAQPASTTDILTDVLNSQAGSNKTVANLVGAKKTADCFTMATNLVTDGGAKTMDLFTKATSETPPANPNDGGLLSKVLNYVQTGCAKEHLTKALGLLK